MIIKQIKSGMKWLVALLPGLLAGPGMAADAPLWEFGAGIGVLSMPDYRGSDERHVYALPIPYLVYRGERLQVERDKVRGLFYKGERSEWDISLGAAVPVKSNDNRARVGMPDLAPTEEIGPQWSYKLRDDWIKATLRLPVRKVLAADWPDIRAVGTVFTPTLALDRDDHPWSGWHSSISTGPIFADKNYFQYYYGVTANQVAPGRPSWDASSGYGGFQATFTLTRRFKDFWVGGFLRGDYLGGSAFKDSPLVKRDVSWMGGIGISWVFMESGGRVSNSP